MNLITILFAFFISTFASAMSLEVKLYHLAKENHVGLPYAQVKTLMFSSVDNVNGLVCSAYTPSQCQERHQRLLKRSNRFKLNIEHTWPQSKGAKEMPANSDMHHLFVTSKESNSMRANHPFCNSVYSYWDYDGSVYGFDEYSQDCFEPQDDHKGNVARAMFYFSIRYQMAIDSDEEKVLRQWNRLDPIDGNEIRRHEVIKRLQGNVNPFIQDSSLVDKISNF
jgi:endonuclease I